MAIICIHVVPNLPIDLHPKSRWLLASGLVPVSVLEGDEAACSLVVIDNLLQKFDAAYVILEARELRNEYVSTGSSQ